MWCNGGQKTDTSKSSDLDNNQHNIHRRDALTNNTSTRN